MELLQSRAFLIFICSGECYFRHQHRRALYKNADVELLPCYVTVQCSELERIQCPCRCYVNKQDAMETQGAQHSKSPPLRVIVSRRRRSI